MEKNTIRISDYGLTLMKLSYGFDIDTEHKQEVLETIVMQNRAKIDNGLIYLDVLPQQFSVGVNQFARDIESHKHVSSVENCKNPCSQRCCILLLQNILKILYNERFRTYKR